MTATVKDIQRAIDETLQGGQTELLKALSQALFEKASPDFLQDFDPESLLAMTVGALTFLEAKRPEELSVRVFNPSYQADGWESPYTVVQLALSDRPFIVDSVRAEVRRQGAELQHFLHPIFNLERKGGKVARLLPPQEQGSLEAFEIFFVERIDEESRHRELEAELRRVLGDLILATDDFRAMREQVSRVRGYLNDLRARLEKGGAQQERAEDLLEYERFLAWLDAGNFIYLCYREYDIQVADGERSLKLDEGSGLGILRKTFRSAYQEPTPLAEISAALRERITGGPLLIVTKSNAESTVHRPVRMDYIGVKKLDESWEVRGERRILGLFTSKALSTPVEETPILRRKLKQVLELDGATLGSHDYKQIVSIFNSMPREGLFWADPESLHREIRTIMGMQQERGVRLTVRPDPLARGLAVMVIMPRSRFNAQVRRRIQDLLSERFGAQHVDYQLSMGEDEEQVRFHFFLITNEDYSHFDLAALERDVSELTRSWQDRLLERLVATHGEVQGRRLAESYEEAFSEGYRAANGAGAALRDIDNLEQLAEEFRVDLVNPVEARYRDPATHLKIYHRRDSLILSDIMPLLENLGLKVLEQISYGVSKREGKKAAETRCGIDVFRVQDSLEEPLDIRRHEARLVETVLALLFGRGENDRLNRLVLAAGLSWRQVALLRALQAYYAQIDAVTSRRFLIDTMLNHPAAAAAVYRAFEAKFKPDIEARETRMKGAREAFFDSLGAVSSLAEDRSLRGVFNVTQAAVRSNFFEDKPYISLKIASHDIETMPEPRPLFEITVMAANVEGVHLRGGMVARGGIRWSDRPDDFRTEVLGLMKTQMTKNAVIVPVGSKGGFVLKGAPSDPAALRDYVVEGYKTFIRGLLDLTDNITGGEIVHPDGLVIHDQPDAYLVVAADKGTASFSDIANELSAEYGFWLGDAFASGGSQGYDHKKEGITARGAWECVARHFREMAVDVRAQGFTVAGIGDMAGDVFGNGMLYSDKIRLQAAFNHQHVFLDPDPDAAKAYGERKRLFETPRSSWQDYDRSLISTGGGVFARHAKSISLSPEAQEMLGVERDSLSGQDLVRAVLKMPVDLLWNGGIGTYVKSASERHSEVGDSSNDAVRIDASELRAQVVGEGGNLGFTQLARVEYALSGGRINTDAIDNSAGVDMSDHEVNIKILLEPLVRSGDLSLRQRNRLLEDMTAEVSRLVLHNNYSQSLCLSLSQRRSRGDVFLFESLLQYLEERGGLAPKVEFLPSHKEVVERAKSGRGLSRPELAILLAYTKMGIYRRLLETDFPDEPYFQHYLYDYFPGAVRERFAQAVKEHRLRREIVATQFTNKVVDLLGETFVHRSIRDTGASPVEVIRAALVVLEVLEVEPFLAAVFALDNEVAAEAQYDAIGELVKTVEDVSHWMLLTGADMSSLAALIEAYRGPLRELRGALVALLPGRERDNVAAAQRRFEEAGFGADLAAAVAGLEYLPSAMNVIDAGQAAGVSLEEAGRAYYLIGDRLHLGWLRDSLRAVPTESKWEKIALGGLVMELRQVQRQLAIHYLVAKQARKGENPLDFLETQHRLLARYDSAVAEARGEEGLSLASGEVLARLLAQMVASSARPAGNRP
ncbi:NAD-glutamate dehydrogenase [soil metagenome]